MSPFPWRSMIRLGMGDLQMAPDRFWNMSFREFNLLVAARFPPQFTLSRSALEHLMAAFPDDPASINHQENPHADQPPGPPRPDRPE